MAAKYPAKDAIMYLSADGSSAATSVVGISGFTINYSTDKIPVTSFGDANKVQVLGLPEASATWKGFWDTDETKLFTAATSTTGCYFFFYPSRNVSTKYWYGPAWMDLSMNTDVAGAVELSGTFAARGSWGKTF